MWHSLQQLSNCVNEGVYFLFPMVTQGHLFQQLIHLLLLTEIKYISEEYMKKRVVIVYIGKINKDKGLTCILSKLQWNRLSASFSWFSSSAVGGLYRSLRDSFTGW